MTDRERLELAAKACGNGAVWYKFFGMGLDNGSGIPKFWNPLDCDSDAFRLAVDLRMFVRCGKDAEIESPVTIMCDSVETDPRAATRRAIVCAAAEIGRAMA